MTARPASGGRIYYLAGPMAGYIEHNHPAFHLAAAQLRAAGYTVVNPAELSAPDVRLGWHKSMKRDLHALLWCDAVALLPGWEFSRGATLEVRVAHALDMPLYPVEWLLSPVRPSEDPPQLVDGDGTPIPRNSNSARAQGMR